MKAGVALLLAASAEALNATVSKRTTVKLDITTNGIKATREFSYYVPNGCSNSQCPMLFEFHGQYGSIGTYYDQTASSNGIIMVNMQGLGDGGCGTGWNTVVGDQDISGSCTSPTLPGSCCYDSCKEMNTCSNQAGCRWATCHDDVEFTRQVVDNMRNRVNAGDIFVTGESNGGMFTHALMTALPGLFKAFVPVYGLPLTGQWDLGSDVTSGLAGKSVFYMHGRSDGTIPAAGGNAGGWFYVAERDAMQTLASLNGCSSSTSSWSTPYDGGRKNTACIKHDGCPSGVTIAQCLYDGDHGAFPNNGNDLLFWFLTQNTQNTFEVVSV